MKKYIIDILIFLFGNLFLITYNYSENLSPRGLLLVVQLLFLWFLLRIVIYYFPKIANILTAILAGWGFVEAIWGLGQLYGIFPAGHTIFKITGSFFNPGPYGGFIGVILPLTLHYWLLFQRQKNKFQYLFLSVILISILILPATLSRTAWLACLLGCTLVLLGQKDIRLRLNNFRQRSKRILLPSIIFISIFLIGIGYLGYDLKKNSANGRFFIWKMSILASKENLFIGEGIGCFPKKYANAQENYFMQGIVTENEKNVAGSPEYAFNEYLRLLVEQGSIGLLLFLMISALIIRKGIQNQQWGITGSFVALSIFAFASYPYYLWQFLITWVLLGVLCLQDEERNYHKKKYVGMSSVFILGFFLAYLGYVQYGYHQAEKEWKSISFLYSAKMYNDIQEKYQNLYSKLNANPKFVFEYASTLNGVKQYEKANEVIQRGLLLSCDPMFYNLQGRNYHEMGNYSQAEEVLLKSINLLPKRIYPYYLLVKLYADPANYQPEKMKQAARYVLEESPKVHSLAIDEMRREVRSILKENEDEKRDYIKNDK